MAWSRASSGGYNARRMRQESETRGTVAIRLSFSPGERVPGVVQHKDNRGETVENRRKNRDHQRTKQWQALFHPRRKNIRKTTECLSTLEGSTAFSGTECRKRGGTHACKQRRFSRLACRIRQKRLFCWKIPVLKKSVD